MKAEIFLNGTVKHSRNVLSQKAKQKNHSVAVPISAAFDNREPERKPAAVFVRPMASRIKGFNIWLESNSIPAALSYGVPPFFPTGGLATQRPKKPRITYTNVSGRLYCSSITYAM